MTIVTVVKIQRFDTNERTEHDFRDRNAAIRFVSYMTMVPVKTIDWGLRCHAGWTGQRSYTVHRDGYGFRVEEGCNG